jgi:hypothetical protein
MSVQVLKFLEVSLEHLEKDAELFQLIDTFLDQFMENKEQMKEDVQLLKNLVEELFNQEENSEKYFNIRKRTIRFLKLWANRLELEVVTEKTPEVKNVSDFDPSIPVYTYQDVYNLLIESQIKVEDLKATIEIQKLKKFKSNFLTQLFESVTEYTNSSFDSDQILGEKLQQIVDAFILNYGGNGKPFKFMKIGFFAPLDISQNEFLGAHGKVEGFLKFVVSKSMKSQTFFTPNLSKCHMMKQIIMSKVYKYFKPEEMSFIPKGHSSLFNTVIFPVVNQKTTVALSRIFISLT